MRKFARTTDEKGISTLELTMALPLVIFGILFLIGMGHALISKQHAVVGGQFAVHHQRVREAAPNVAMVGQVVSKGAETFRLSGGGAETINYTARAMPRKGLIAQNYPLEAATSQYQTPRITNACVPHCKPFDSFAKLLSPELIAGIIFSGNTGSLSQGDLLSIVAGKGNKKRRQKPEGAVAISPGKKASGNGVPGNGGAPASGVAPAANGPTTASGGGGSKPPGKPPKGAAGGAADDGKSGNDGNGNGGGGSKPPGKPPKGAAGGAADDGKPGNGANGNGGNGKPGNGNGGNGNNGKPVNLKKRRIDESERKFSKAERKIAEYLDDRGHLVKALKEDHRAPGRKADAEVDGKRTEFKSLDPGATDSTVKNTVNDSVRRGGQARNIVIDARDSGLSEEAARKGLARAGGITRGRVDSVRIIGDGYDITSTDFK
jgi:hypothetical protein